MKILSLQTNPPTFSAKNKDIRKADDIMRKSKQEFTMFSPTHALTFYKTLEPENEIKEITRDIFQAYTSCKLKYKVRDPSASLERLQSNKIPYVTSLEILKKEKLGNCHESTIATLATLYANGYYNSYPVSINYRYKFVDKTTGNIILKGTRELDHVVVLTDMNNSDKKSNIVIDSWLGKTDEKQNASIDYYHLFKNTINEEIKMIIEATRTDVSNCDLFIKSSYQIADYCNRQYCAQLIGELVREKYPTLIL